MHHFCDISKSRRVYSMLKGRTVRSQVKWESRPGALLLLVYKGGMPRVSFFIVVQSLSRTPLFETPWTIGLQAPLSSIISRSLLKFMSIESVMLSNHLIICGPLSFWIPSIPASGSFPTSQLFTSGGQTTGASASTSVLPMNIQGWFPLGFTV